VREEYAPFDNTQQHDATEFLALWRQRLATPPGAPGGPEPSTTWAAWRTEAQAVPTKYIRCRGCGLERSDLPENREPNGLWLATVKPAGSYAGVLDALRQCTPENADEWECEACRGRGATQWYRYQELPAVLIIQLKRYYYTPDGSRRSNAAVPAEETLDLAEFLEPAAQVPPGGIVEVPDDDAAPAAGGGDAGDADPRRSHYRLRAVVCHEGETTTKGHYTTWVRERPSAPGGEAEAEEPPPPPRWTEYDDTAVTPGHESLPGRVARNAYLVFYEQCAAPVQGGGSESASPEPPGPPPQVDLTEDTGDEGGLLKTGATSGRPRSVGPVIEGPLAHAQHSAAEEPSRGSDVECDEEPEKDVIMEDA